MQRLAAGPPIGTVGDALLPVDRASDATPPRRLIARGLLIPIDMQTVELPRRGRAAWCGAPNRSGAVSPDPPPIPTIDRAPEELDRLGATAVLDTVRLHRGARCQSGPIGPRQRCGGGVGVRELRRAARPSMWARTLPPSCSKPRCGRPRRGSRRHGAGVPSHNGLRQLAKP